MCVTLMAHRMLPPLMTVESNSRVGPVYWRKLGVYCA